MRLNKLSMAMTLATVTSMGLASAAQASTVIRVAYGNQPGKPVDVAVKQWAEWVNEASSGEIELKAFPASQLGSETDVMEQARFGSALDYFDYRLQQLSKTHSNLAVLDAPYLSEDFESKLKSLILNGLLSKCHKLSPPVTTLSFPTLYTAYVIC